MRLNITKDEVLKLADTMQDVETRKINKLKEVLEKKEKAIKDKNIESILNYNSAAKLILEDLERHYKWLLELRRQLCLLIKAQEKEDQ